MFHKSKIKLTALLVISLSVASLLVHLYLANSSSGDFFYQRAMLDDFFPTGQKLRLKKLWGSVSSLESFQPYASPRNKYPAPSDINNGFIFAKIYGGFEKIRPAICDLVTISRLLNATLVVPEIQDSVRSKGISSKFKSFSYIYDEERFIDALTNDVIVVSSLPKFLKEERKKNKFPMFKPERSASPSYYIKEVLPKLRKSKAIGLVINDGGCLQSILPPSMTEYQRVRCRVAFHALQFRPGIQSLGKLMVKRLRAFGQPYLVFNPGLVKETLAYHGCAELFQDVHTELIQYRRAQMIKRGIIHEELSIDSAERRKNGSCPLMPEEVGLLFRAMGYPPNTIIYLAGSEIFGGQRVLIPLRAMYSNLIDRTSLCSKKELANLIGPESPLPSNLPQPPPSKSEEELIEEWKKAGPRPRPLPPPPARPFYAHEKVGWYGWVAEADKEPEPSPVDMRNQAHRLLWDALDYYVSVEADAFFPGFSNDGSGWPDFSSLVMGHRLYRRASSITYRPNRKTVTELFDSIRDNMYHPRRNWTALMREHLNMSLGLEGVTREAQMSKPTLFLSHPLPECTCRISNVAEIPTPSGKSSISLPHGSEDRCPEWMVRDLNPLVVKSLASKDESSEDTELPDDDVDIEGQTESEDGRTDSGRPSEQDEEMDPDD